MNQLEKNINTLQEKIYLAITQFTTFEDISKKFLPDKEIAVNILKKKNPSITDEQCRLIIGAASQANQNTQDPATRSSIASQVYPLPTSNGIYGEVKKVKDEVRENLMLFVNNQVDIVQDLAKMVLKISNSISAAVVLVAPLSFNLPAAISLLIIIVDGINLLIKKCMDILSNLGPMNNLVLVLPSNFFDVITAPINLFLTAMIQIIDKITLIRQQIDNLINSFLSFLSNSAASFISSLIDEITKKESEKDKLINDGVPLTSPQVNTIQQEINDLRDRLNKLQGINTQNPAIPTPVNGKFDEKLATDFLNTLGNAKTEVQVITEIIYDLTLPDGSVILDVDPDTIENLKNKYNVVYKD